MQNQTNVGLAEGLRLAVMLSRRDMRTRYANSFAGVAWSIALPLLFALVNVVVFSVLMTGRMGTRYGDVPFSLFYFVPFSLWALFTEVTSRSTSILREYHYLITKIAFPTWVIPLVPLASALVSQLVMFAIIAFLLVTKSVMPSPDAWAFFVIWGLTVVMTIGVSYLVSSIAMYIPDVGQLVPVLVTILFWLTPILYPAAMAQDGPLWFRNMVMHFNPFYYMVESARLAVLGAEPLPWSYVGIFACFAGVTLLLGWRVFSKLKAGFADV